MSPEQATLNQLDIDTRSDVYSLGVVLYELLAGSPPFRSDELLKAGYLEILRVIREEEPPKPSTKVSTAKGLPEIAGARRIDADRLGGLLRSELDWLVMKSLEKERSRRYDSPAAFAADVQRFLDGDMVHARPPSTAYKLRKFAAKYRAAVASTAAILTILTAALIATSYLARKESVARRKAELAEAATARERDTGETAISLHGHQASISHLAVTTAPDGIFTFSRDGTVKQWLNSVHDGLKLVLKRSDHIRAIAFSNNGEMIATGTESGDVHVFAIQDKSDRTMPTPHTGQVRGIQFAEDDRSLTSITHDPRLKPLSWNLESNKVTESVTRPSVNLPLFRVAPDESLFIFALRDRLFLADLEYQNSDSARREREKMAASSSAWHTTQKGLARGNANNYAMVFNLGSELSQASIRYCVKPTCPPRAIDFHQNRIQEPIYPQASHG